MGNSLNKGVIMILKIREALFDLETLKMYWSDMTPDMINKWINKIKEILNEF